jgi:Gas vesicle protein
VTVGDNSLVPSGYGGAVAGPQPSNLGDILERVLDKGIVIAGDIQVNLLDIELLTIKLRLVVASLDTAKQAGIDWWEHDPWLTGKNSKLEIENERLRDRIEQLERGNGERRAVRGRSAEYEDER